MCNLSTLCAMLTGMDTPPSAQNAHPDAADGAAPDQLIRPAEAARRLGVTTTTLARWADLGLIGAQRGPTGVRRYRASEVDRFAATAQQAGRDGAS